jgi:hypothetical protein
MDPTAVDSMQKYDGKEEEHQSTANHTPTSVVLAIHTFKRERETHTHTHTPTMKVWSWFSFAVTSRHRSPMILTRTQLWKVWESEL